MDLGGAGRHTTAILIQDPNTLVNWFKVTKAEELCYHFAKTFPRLAILTLYLKIFSTRNYRRAVYIIGALLIVDNIANVIASLVTCRPLAYFWDKSIPNGHCADVMTFWRYVSLANLSIDIPILILPMPAIAKLQVDAGVKMGLFITFTCAGWSVIFFSISIQKYT